MREVLPPDRNASDSQPPSGRSMRLPAIWEGAMYLTSAYRSISASGRCGS